MFCHKTKLFLALAACLAVLAAGLSADVIKLGHFPKGKWLDTQWQAYWTFGDDTIELRDVHDQVIYDFAGIVQRLKVEDLDQGGIRLSFDCAKARRSYLFEKATATAPMAMSIRQYGSTIAYKTAMPVVSESNLAEYKQAVIEAKTEDVARIVAVIEQAASVETPAAPPVVDQAVLRQQQLDFFLVAADKTDFSQLEQLAAQAESDGQADALIQDLEAKAAQPDAPPGVFIGLSVLYGRKNLKTQSYAALALAEKAPPKPGVAINLALVYGRKQLLAGAPDADQFLVGDVEVVPSEAAATVIVDGTVRGTGGMVIRKLPAGFHNIKVTLDGYGEWETTIDLGVGQYRNLEVKLKSLNDSSHPTTANVSFGWISPEYAVSLGGRALGKAELGDNQTVTGLAPGAYELAVDIPGYDTYRVNLNLAAGQDMSVGKPLVIFGAPLASELFKVQQQVDNTRNDRVAARTFIIISGVLAGLGVLEYAITAPFSGYISTPSIIFGAMAGVGLAGLGVSIAVDAGINPKLESLWKQESELSGKLEELAMEDVYR